MTGEIIDGCPPRYTKYQSILDLAPGKSVLFRWGEMETADIVLEWHRLRSVAWYYKRKFGIPFGVRKRPEGVYVVRRNET